MQQCLPFSLDSQKAFGKHLGFVALFAGQYKSSGICDKAPKPGKWEGKTRRCHERAQTLPFCREKSTCRETGCKRPSPRQFQTYTEMPSILTKTPASSPSLQRCCRILYLFTSRKAAASVRALQRKKRVAGNLGRLSGMLRVLPGKEPTDWQTNWENREEPPAWRWASVRKSSERTLVCPWPLTQQLHYWGFNPRKESEVQTQLRTQG